MSQRGWSWCCVLVAAVFGTACGDGEAGSNGKAGRSGDDGQAGQTGPAGPAGPPGPGRVVVDATGEVVEGAVEGWWFDEEGYIWLIDLEEGRPKTFGPTGSLGSWMSTADCDDGDNAWFPATQPRLVYEDRSDYPAYSNVTRADDALSVELGFFRDGAGNCIEEGIAPILGVAADDMEDAPETPDISWPAPLRYAYQQ